MSMVNGNKLTINRCLEILISIYLYNESTGYGVYYWKSGAKYEGTFMDGMKHGHGTHYKLDGDKYVGEWQFDSRSGRGFYYWHNGGYYEVHFSINIKLNTIFF